VGSRRAVYVRASYVLVSVGVVAALVPFRTGLTAHTDLCSNRGTLPPIWPWLTSLGAFAMAFVLVMSARSTRAYDTRETMRLTCVAGVGILVIAAWFAWVVLETGIGGDCF
jgi:hypothetical protein